MSASAPTLDEISAALAVIIAPITADLASLNKRVDTMELSFNSRLDGFIAATDANFAHVIRRLDGIDRRLEALEDNRLAAVEQRVAALEAKLAG